MKRRNREQRARMRTIQTFHLTKPYQRAMDLFHKNTGLAYRAIYWVYKINTLSSSWSIDMSRFEFNGIKKNEDGTYEMNLIDRGRPLDERLHITFRVKDEDAAEESDCGIDEAL